MDLRGGSDQHVGLGTGLPGGLKQGPEFTGTARHGQADLEDLPTEARQLLEVHPVEELGEVLALALKDVRYTEGKLLFGDENPRDVVPLNAGYRH